MNAIPTITGLHDVLDSAQKRLNALRTQNRTDELIETLHKMGETALLIGDGMAALSALQEAVGLAEPTPALLLTYGQGLCFTGDYTAGRAHIEKALSTASDDSLRASCLLSLGRADHSEQEGIHLTEAIGLLQAGKLDEQVAACSLALAAFHLHHHNQAECEAYLKQADTILSACKLFWDRPEWWRLSALLALEKQQYAQVVKCATRGLGAVDNRGDVRVLAGLYRAFATALERHHERIEDARDARHRSTEAARASAPRLELAYALYELGHHYKTYSNRPTLRARGAGYLFEADRLFREMGIAPPVG